MTTSPYATDKLAAYPDTVKKLRDTGAGDLLTVHLMPQNACNQACAFCSYRLPDNKNSEAFNEQNALPWASVPPLLDDFQALGVKGVELTGGGEPLGYPRIAALLHALHERRLAVGLVTNGTLLSKLALEEFGPLRWARVSIDAATPETYTRMRKSRASHFRRAWAAVRWLAERREHFHEDFRLGVGFVLSNENLEEALPFVEMAKAAGADNARLSLAFSDRHLDYFGDKRALEQAIIDCSTAKREQDSASFTVHNLTATRYSEQQRPTQEYRRCPTKDVLCVVEGSGKVYTCCTFTGSARGCYGNYLTHAGGFAGLWRANTERRRTWDARKECRVACLYRQRNLAMNALIDAPPIHTEFI